MSSGAKMDRRDAWPVAAKVVEWLGPVCDRVEIAGSLRRGAPLVSDIEIVCVPRTTSVPVDLFGTLAAKCLLAERVHAAVKAGDVRWRTETHPTPPKDWAEARRFWALVVADAPLDLFAVRPPAQWGAIFAIRTGPHTFSQRLVTDCQRRGLRCVGGHLERNAPPGAVVPTPTERDFFRACGVPWAEPGDRR